ncbi:MAG: nicotinamide mononucleotide transporter [Alphaproteobacteria bacterium]|nr:nicotinamide mononucleotide transporter [Alphaproteobacteria bacterium]
MLQMLELGATIFGLLQGLLVLLNKRSNWLFFIAQMICLLAFSWQNKLYGDVLNSTIYLFFGIIGFICWSSDNGNKKITACNKKEKAIYVLIILSATLLLNISLKNTQDPLPLIDSFTTTSSMVATVYMVLKKIDTWFIWFVNDIVYVAEYGLLDTPAYYLIGLNLIWAAMAVCSYFYWKKTMKGYQK